MSKYQVLGQSIRRMLRYFTKCSIYCKEFDLLVALEKVRRITKVNRPRSLGEHECLRTIWWYHPLNRLVVEIVHRHWNSLRLPFLVALWIDLNLIKGLHITLLTWRIVAAIIIPSDREAIITLRIAISSIIFRSVIQYVSLWSSSPKKKFARRWRRHESSSTVQDVNTAAVPHCTRLSNYSETNRLLFHIHEH